MKDHLPAMVHATLERGRQTRRAEPQPARRAWLRSLALLPSAVLALLPSATCPVCIVAYAGVLSAFGLGFLFNEQVLAPLVGVFLLVGIASIAYSTRSHRRYGPLLATLAGAGSVAAGRLVWHVPFLLYSGIALLIGAAVWNLWLKRPGSSRLVSDPADASRETAVPACCEGREQAKGAVHSTTLSVDGMT